MQRRLKQQSSANVELREEAGGAVTLILHGLLDISRRTDELAAQLQATVVKLDQAIGSLNPGSLNEMLDNFRRASRDLDETLTRIKQYPAGALLRQPPPPARSVERPAK